MRKPFLLLACALAACGKPTAKEKEPNDHFTQAGVLPAGGKAVGTIGSASDVDFFKLVIARERASVSLHVGGIRDVDFVLSVQDKERQELKRYDETALGGDEHALDLGLERGEYFVALSNKNAKANNPGQEYALECAVEAAEGREWEPDDRPLLATPLAPGGVTKGHYFPTQNLLSDAEDKAEEDWFRVKVDKQGAFVLNLDLSEVPKIDPVLEVYDANGYRLKEIDTGGPGEPETLRHFGVRGPAEFLLRLRTKPTRSGAVDPGYELLSELLPYDGRAEFEPNDQRLDATALAGSITGTIGGAGDADWYQVVVPGDGRQVLRAEVSPLAGADLRLEVCDELGNPIVAVDDAAKEQAEILTGLGVTPGTYYLMVAEKGGKFGDPRKAYTLSRSLDAWRAGLEFESSASSKTSQALALGESLDGYLAPKGDVEWYEFTVPQKGKVAVELTGLANVRWSAALLDSENKPLHEVSAKKAAESVAFDHELEPGTYWLRLRAEDAGQSNARDKYTVRLRQP